MTVARIVERVVGRDEEFGQILRVLDAVRAGPAAVLIEGEAGIGKSTLWRATLDEGARRGHRVLACHPTRAETRVSFAGLIDLLDPVADDVLGALPSPQRHAIEVALLRVDATDRIEPGAVAIAMLRAIRLLARASPVMIAIDDLQWLDRSSSRILEFTLRRLADEPVAVVIAGRPGSRALDAFVGSFGMSRVTHIRLPALSRGDLYRLIHERLGIAVARPELNRIHEASGGNPLVALELVRASADPDANDPTSHPMPLPRPLTDLLRTRIGRLPARTRQPLLVAAAMSVPTLDQVRIVVGTDDADLSARLEVAERAGVIEPGEHGLRFTHPLMASTVYDAASPAERRRVHRGLAASLVDPEERAHHLALATLGPDESVAVVLEEATARAHARGASDVAARFAEQALALTPDDAAAATFRRSLAAGSMAMLAGDRVRAQRFLGHAAALPAAGRDHAEALLQLAEVVHPLRRRLELCGLALEDAGDDSALRSRIHRVHGAVAYDLGDVVVAEEQARSGVRHAEAAGDRATLGKALGELGHWTFCGGGGVRRAHFRLAIELDPSPAADGARGHYGAVLGDAGHDDEARLLLEGLVEEALRTGDLTGAAMHTYHLAEVEMWSGRWTEAVRLATESLELRQHLDQPSGPLYVIAMCHALAGDLEGARREAEEGLEDAERNESVAFLIQNLHVLGFIELSRGDHRAAIAPLRRASDLLRPRWSREFGGCRFVPDEIETVIALGNLERAADLVDWMAEVGRRTRRRWTLATGGRCRALLHAARGDLDAAAAAIDLALREHDHLAMPFELARTRLVAGTILRRRKQRAAARSVLDEALATFERLGAPVWAAHVRAEISRLGDRTTAQRGLTPVELDVARLVADGRTNRQIAARLFLSPKTVEAILSRMFRKLDIGSRAELAALLPRVEAGRSEEGPDLHA